MEKLLVIEDEQSLRENIVKVLHFEGFNVISAENGEIGIQLAFQHHPDLIICDIMMPQLDGYGVLREIRHNPATFSIPLLFLTAKAEKEDYRLGMNNGADDYITKPFTQKDLLDAVSAQIKKHSLFTRHYENKIESLRTAITSTFPHELRTPLGGIMGWIGYLKDNLYTFSHDQIHDSLEHTYRSVLRLHHTIENYLIYMQLNTERVTPETLQIIYKQLEANPVYPMESIKQVAQRKAKEFQREADLNLSLEDTIVYVPERDLMKIVDELIDNAFKFSTAGSPVHVNFATTEEGYLLSFTDYGRGMQPEQINAIEAFTQFERATYEQQGMGLGLIISRYLAELYDGKFIIESEVNKYTTIRVIFPSR